MKIEIRIQDGKRLNLNFKPPLVFILKCYFKFQWFWRYCSQTDLNFPNKNLPDFLILSPSLQMHLQKNRTKKIYEKSILFECIFFSQWVRRNVQYKASTCQNKRVQQMYFNIRNDEIGSIIVHQLKEFHLCTYRHFILNQIILTIYLTQTKQPNLLLL